MIVFSIIFNNLRCFWKSNLNKGLNNVFEKTFSTELQEYQNA